MAGQIHHVECGQINQLAMQMENEIQTFWSEEDAGFIAKCHEFPYLSAFGETREDAIREFTVALKGSLEIYCRTGDYSKWRKYLFYGMTLEEINEEATKNWNAKKSAELVS